MGLTRACGVEPQVEDELDALTPVGQRPPSALARLGHVLAGAPAVLTAAAASVRKLLAPAAQTPAKGGAEAASAGGELAGSSGRVAGGGAEAVAGTAAGGEAGSGSQPAAPWWEQVRSAVLGPQAKSG
jgi:hypothetical protein